MGRKIWKYFVPGIAALLLQVSAVQAERLKGSDEIGARDHPAMVQQLGGEITDPVLSEYVRSIGFKLVALTPEAHEAWTFTVLDSPVVNAFALPGGYVYVTRGLLAIANDEAELAAVLGHEIGHVLSHHGEDRISRNNKTGIGVIIGAVLGGVFGGQDGAADAIEFGLKVAQGYMASHSKSEELEADRIGVEMLAKAGYDPLAEARFLSQLAAKEALEKQISGQEYNPNRVDFFASHPATGERIKRAERIASKASDGSTGQLNEHVYLSKIDGMIYGDTSREGYIRGTVFSHPELKFTFTVPNGFILQNSPQNVVAQNGVGSRFIVDGDAKWSGAMDRYISERWLPAVGQTTQISDFRDLRHFKMNGLDAATAMIDIQTKNGPGIAQLTAIRFGDMTVRIAAVTARDSGRDRNLLNTATQSFRRLTDKEASRLHPFRIKIVTVGTRDTVRSIAKKMPVGKYSRQVFLAMNGYHDETDMRAGDLVKVIE